MNDSPFAGPTFDIAILSPLSTALYVERITPILCNPEGEMRVLRSTASRYVDTMRKSPLPPIPPLLADEFD
jgi:hypothetical protein